MFLGLCHIWILISFVEIVVIIIIFVLVEAIRFLRLASVAAIVVVIARIRGILFLPLHFYKVVHLRRECNKNKQEGKSNKRVKMFKF